MVVIVYVLLLLSFVFTVLGAHPVASSVFPSSDTSLSVLLPSSPAPSPSRGEQTDEPRAEGTKGQEALRQKQIPAEAPPWHSEETGEEAKELPGEGGREGKQYDVGSILKVGDTVVSVETGVSENPQTIQETVGSKEQLPFLEASREEQGDPPQFVRQGREKLASSDSSNPSVVDEKKSGSSDFVLLEEPFAGLGVNAFGGPFDVSNLDRARAEIPNLSYLRLWL
uniref:Uncharacterized protein n=2 Tax=Chromera velia CCMP2878 TaxID=1169474 RepID=A0A0K6S7N6_9ALVE|eukprot:Cvel_4899.t1-p1 / transcript=Cvel_4899.t1 / gene=Cvel_4899 / organism=Chromera_velia_CCMP2878 / gene_product=hypothetical protein / transcript_product=hypothetical protein / location=Cvel_scaffold221:6825-7496(-) / protein_length=224 / sequence_SO=supercontig / SO=protein_coding / is_pseudo=false